MKVSGFTAVLSAVILVGTAGFFWTEVRKGDDEMMIPPGTPHEITRNWIEETLTAREEMGTEDNDHDVPADDVPVILYKFRNSNDGTEFITSVPAYFVFGGLKEWEVHYYMAV